MPKTVKPNDNAAPEAMPTATTAAHAETTRVVPVPADAQVLVDALLALIEYAEKRGGSGQPVVVAGKAALAKFNERAGGA